IGLTYETFTSSVLLLQGRAEKLLDSTAKGRFEVLAGIVDLERFARLHARADDRRRELKAKHEALQHQLDALPDVPDAELAAADERIAARRRGMGYAGANRPRTSCGVRGRIKSSDSEARGPTEIDHRGRAATTGLAGPAATP